MEKSCEVVLRGLKARVQNQIEAAVSDMAYFESLWRVWGGDSSQNPAAYVLATDARAAARERLAGLERLLKHIDEAKTAPDVSPEPSSPSAE